MNDDNLNSRAPCAVVESAAHISHNDRRQRSGAELGMGMDAIGAPAAARDGSAVKGWLRALELTKPIAAQPARTLPTIIDELARRHGAAPALLSERETLSFRELAARANRYARWALAQGLGKGDVVALMMPNRPEYMAAWLGITRTGAVTALINNNLSGGSLAHCIDAVAPAHVIVDAGLAGALATARRSLRAAPRTWSHGAAGAACERIDHAFAAISDAPLAADELRPVTVADPALLIYTSGTTGLPKAAKVSHHRLLTWSLWFAGMIDSRPGDRMYNCLPMYHSIGGVVATGAVLVNGGSVFVREKFSAGRFWDEVARYDCTLFQYIGELCRYLLQAPPHPRERTHRLRLACGNGLRAGVWEAFQARFRVPRILEFYAATEGNVTLFNLEGRPGAVGRIPPFLAHRAPVALVRHDFERGGIVRDADGRCVRCGPGETGEAIGRIGEGEGRFEGYTDAGESEKKIVRDAFAPGDAWFRTGDLMRRDEAGYFHFVDRIGDTFRWKGENVAASEVAQVLAGFPGISDAVVYGVTVPGSEGRAGMAALVMAGPPPLAALRAHVAARLPAYARPLFLRIRSELDATETFKPKKAALQQDGFDPARIADPLYFDDAEAGAYVPLDGALHARIRAGRARL
jgi:fatty-acyl-CoA synthase